MRIALLSLSLSWLLIACEPAGGSGPGPIDTGDTGGATDPGVWAFEAVDGMVCGGGHATGIGVNEGSDPTKVVVVMAGGGGCWDALSCFALQSAANLEVAWGEDHMVAETTAVAGTGLLDRADAGPLSDATWVYVPYCTGDLHIGRTERVHNALEPNRVTHHKGDLNIEAMLGHVSDGLPDVEDVWVIGISAGGYGAQMQADRYAGTWPDAKVRIFADGSPMVQPVDGRYGAWKAAWDPRFPDGCTDCATQFSAVLAAQAAGNPDVPFALTTFGNDEVITAYLNYPSGWLLGAQRTLIEEQYASSDQLSVFALTGTAHTMLGQAGQHSVEGVSARDWFETWAADGALGDLGEL